MKLIFTSNESKDIKKLIGMEFHALKIENTSKTMFSTGKENGHIGFQTHVRFYYLEDGKLHFQTNHSEYIFELTEGDVLTSEGEVYDKASLRDFGFKASDLQFIKTA